MLHPGRATKHKTNQSTRFKALLISISRMDLQRKESFDDAAGKSNTQV